MRRKVLSGLVLMGLFFGLVAPHTANAEQRVALVIGNSGYIHTPVLSNPNNDARAIAATLKRLNFEVVLALDVRQNEIAQPISQFSRLLNGADVGVLYYAGHGLSFEGRNYLVPVDASAESAIHVKFQMTPIDRIAAEMAQSVRLNIIILDACRNNPLATQLSRSLGQTSRSADISRGLSAMKPVGRESLILFATAPGQVAADGSGLHSPFTQALLKHIDAPGLSVEDVFRNVRRDVREATANRQLPEMWLRLENRFQFNANSPSVVGGSDAAPSVNRAETNAYDAEQDKLYWESVRGLGDAELFRKYVEEFPNGRYVAIAEHMIARLSKTKQSPDVTTSSINEADRSQSGDGVVSPSFNCRENTGLIEQMICSDQRLARLDLELSQLYFRVYGRLNTEAGLRLRNDQREWLRTRNACANNAKCVENAYTGRIKLLKEADHSRP